MNDLTENKILLYRSNLAFVKNRELPPSNEDEILLNLNYRTGIPVNINPSDKNQIFFRVVVAMIILVPGSMVLYVVLKFIIAAVELHSQINIGDITFFALLVFTASVSIGLGVVHLRVAYLLTQNKNSRMAKLYQGLIKEGVILSGVINEISPLGSGMNVSYEFLNPSNKIIRKHYLTKYSIGSLKQGLNINVLYLDDKINIIL